MESFRIPTTGCRAAFHSKLLGHTSVEAFAESLKDSAVVVDIGAGLSRFGHVVAQLRPDIKWINVDPCYAHANIVKVASRGQPSNLQLLTEDIVHGSAALQSLQNSADLVYSYWLLPHLSIKSDILAITASQHMYDLLKPEGKLIVGPVRKLGIGFFSPYRYKGVTAYTKNEPKEKVSTNIVQSTRLWWLARLAQRFSNRYGIHFGVFFVGGRLKSTSVSKPYSGFIR